MATRTKRSADTQRRFEEGRKAARARVIERGIVAFRADPELMDLLLRVAEYKRVPYGVLARSWVMDCLREEANNLLNTDGSLNIRPVRNKEENNKLFNKAVASGNKRSGKMLKKLANK